MKALGRLSLIVAFVCVCAVTVHAAECGNGIIESGETCDDGNRLPGDCCGPDCVVEEIRQGCETCDDGIDNDGDGGIDAEDSGCATLSDYQRAAIVETKAVELREPGGEPVITSVLLPGALVGEAVDGQCDARDGTCMCPETSPECQALGRPCGTDGDCSAVPFPLGRSRADVCDGREAEDDSDTGCRSQSDLVRKAKAIARIPGTKIDPIDVSKGDAPFVTSFEGGKRIVDLAYVRLEPEAQLVLVGEADTTLVIRVHGDLELGEQAAIDLGGELKAERVLWVLVGAAGRVALGRQVRFVGTLLAPEREAVELGDGVRIYGAILGGEVQSHPHEL